MATPIKAEIIIVVTLLVSIGLGIGLMDFSEKKGEEIENKTQRVSADYTVCEYKLRQRNESMVSGEVRPIPGECIGPSGKVLTDILEKEVFASYMVKRTEGLEIYED